MFGFGGLHNLKHVCVACRRVHKHPFACEHGPSVIYPSRWRAPRKNDTKAWKRITAGDIWWDNRSKSRAAERKVREGWHDSDMVFVSEKGRRVRVPRD
jgi:hypothetical protein